MAVETTHAETEADETKPPPRINEGRLLSLMENAGKQIEDEDIAAALSENAVVITSGPGTGKTTLIRGLVQILGKKGMQAVLAAPTGRAAKRLA